MNRKLLFLDIDGVMNVARRMDEAKRVGLDKYERPVMARHECATEDNPCEPHISVLNAVYDAVPELEIVLSSSWRTDMTRFGWERFLATLGVRAPFLGCTPKFNGWRGVEVAAFLLSQYGDFLKYRHEGSSPSPITNFLVVDDDGDSAFRWIDDRWLRIDNYEGWIDPARAIEMLTEDYEIDWPDVAEHAAPGVQLPKGPWSAY